LGGASGLYQESYPVSLNKAKRKGNSLCPKVLHGCEELSGRRECCERVRICWRKQIRFIIRLCPERILTHLADPACPVRKSCTASKEDPMGSVRGEKRLLPVHRRTFRCFQRVPVNGQEFRCISNLRRRRGGKGSGSSYSWGALGGSPKEGESKRCGYE